MNVLTDPVEVLTTMLMVILSIAFHELAHAYFADLAGDPTPRENGRITLNPFKHFDRLGLGLIIITSLIGHPFGYGITPINPGKMRNPRWDYFLCILAGPVSNLFLAVACGLLFRLVAPNIGGQFALALFRLCHLNLWLMMFNLFPFGILDGSKLVGLLLPPRSYLPYSRFQASFGVFGFFLLLYVLRVPGLFDPVWNLLDAGVSYLTGV